MYKLHEFYESYYYHSCIIVPEKDVLETDIIGKDYFSRLRRWWNDLFLLSLGSDRTRGFYTSFSAMHIERLRQFRKYPNSIHPMSKFRNFWDFLILHVFILNKVLFRFTSSFLYDKLPMSFYYLGALFELIIIADLYVNMKTAYIDDETKRIILDTRESVMRFCADRLFICFISAIPLHWMMFLRYGSNINCGLCKTNRFTCALKIISIFSLFRVYETSAYWTRTHHSGLSSHCFKFLRIIAVGMITMCQFYDLSDVAILLVFLHTGYVDQTSIISFKAGLRYNESMKLNISNSKYVVFEITRIFKSLLLFSFGNKGKVFYLDRIAALIAYVLAKIFYAWSFLECYSIINRILYPSTKLARIIDSSLNMIACRHLPDEFSSKVIRYFNYKPSALKVIENHNTFYKSLPDVLKDEVKLECYLKLVMRVPFFADWPVPVLEQIVFLLQKEVFLSNDIISEALFQGIGLMIVESGVLAVYSDNYKEQGHLIDGDYFGELSLVTDKELGMSFVVSVTPCTVLILEKMAFRRLMRDHLKLFFEMKSSLKRRFSAVSFGSIASLES